MLVKIYPDNPNQREIEQIVNILKNDGIVIYPTDTVYAMGCSLNSKKAQSRLMKIKGVDEKNANFSLICSDLSHLSDYAKVDNPTFKLLKRNLPGAFTFILPASSKVPDRYISKRKTVGLRIPNNSILLAIVTTLGIPLLTTSIKSDDNILEYITDPELIHENYEKLVDIVIDAGYGGIEASTIIDCTEYEYTIVRQGKGVVVT